MTGYTAEFEKGTEFSFGGTVTAMLSNGVTVNVTSEAKFMGYDMNVIGPQEVTVTYTMDGKTVSTTYNIKISEAQNGEEKTVSSTIASIASAKGWSNGTKYETLQLDQIITATANGGSNTGKYYTSGNNWRFYQNENPTLTIAAAEGYTIVSVKVTYTIDKTGVLQKGGTNITSGTSVAVNAKSVTFGVGNTGTVTNGQVRVTAIEVVYQKN